MSYVIVDSHRRINILIRNIRNFGWWINTSSWISLQGWCTGQRWCIRFPIMTKIFERWRRKFVSILRYKSPVTCGGLWFFLNTNSSVEMLSDTKLTGETKSKLEDDTKKMTSTHQNSPPQRWPLSTKLYEGIWKFFSTKKYHFENGLKNFGHHIRGVSHRFGSFNLVWIHLAGRIMIKRENWVI